MAKDTFFQLRLSSAAKAEWQAAALEENLSLAAWICRACSDQIAYQRALAAVDRGLPLAERES